MSFLKKGNLIALAAGALLISKIIRTRSSPDLANTLLNITGTALLAMPLIGVAHYAITSPSTIRPRPSPPPVGDMSGIDRPDIYYFILDGYGRRDILKDYFSYDNSDFLDFLKASGFFVAEDSRSNYNWTFFSLAATLNMDYINDVGDRMGRTSRDLQIPFSMIRDNKVVQTLKSKGYRYVHIDSTWGATQSSPQADVEIAYRPGGFTSEFSRLLLSTTLLKAPSAGEIELATLHLYALDRLRSVCHLPGPKFVFYHVLLPRHPYIFDRQGNVRQRAHLSNQFEFEKQLWRERGQYIEQLAFVTGKIRLAVGDILRYSSRPPVIILQSDHGPTLTDAPQAQAFRARFGILNAIYLPGKTMSFPRTMTSVNTFRILFDTLFGSGLPLLEDRSFYSVFELPYDWQEVFFDEHP